MCSAPKPKTQPASKTPEPAKLQIDDTARRRRRAAAGAGIEQGRNALRIDLNLSSQGPATGLRIPTQ